MNPSMNPHWLDPSGKPKLRGVSHQWAFFVSVVTGVTLVLLAPNGEALLAAGIYSLSVMALFGTATGVTAFGRLHDATGNYDAALAMAAAALAGAALLFLTLRERPLPHVQVQAHPA